MYEKYHTGLEVWSETTECGTQNLVLPPWLCQPYVRDTPENHVKKVELKQAEAIQQADGAKRCYEDAEGNTISRKRMKKLRRIMRRPEKLADSCQERPKEKCSLCENPLVG